MNHENSITDPAWMASEDYITTLVGPSNPTATKTEKACREALRASFLAGVNYGLTRASEILKA